MALRSTGRAQWDGDLASGGGTTTLGSGAAGPLGISWNARTEDQGGLTNPEELLASAHASCYSMALAGALARAGTPPTRLDTEAVATFDKTDDGFRVVSMELKLRGTVPGISEEDFLTAAEAAKEGCPISQALAGNVAISLDATLSPA